MDLRSAPQRILAADGANQSAHLIRHGWPTGLAASNLPGPEQTKTLPMPSNDGGSFHDADAKSPVMPDRTEPGPQESVRSCQLRPFHRALKDTDLVAKRKNLQLERRTAPEPARQRGHERRTNRPKCQLMNERQPSMIRSAFARTTIAANG